MESDERRRHSSLQLAAKRRSPDSGSSSSNQLQGESSSNCSFNGATPGDQRVGASTMLAGSSSSARTEEIHGRTTRQRSTTHGENLVSSAPSTASEQRDQQSGELNAQQGGQQDSGSLQENPTPNRGQIFIIPDSAFEGHVPQAGDPRLRTRLTSELRNLMGLQDRGGIIRYHSHYRVPRHWWLVGVVYQPDDDHDEEGVDTMSYEEVFAGGENLGNVREISRSVRMRTEGVSTGLSKEEILAKMKQRKYSGSMTSPPDDVEICIICQEEYADNDDIGKLDNCRHEFHVACIKEWLAQNNSCPICKSTALAT